MSNTGLQNTMKILSEYRVLFLLALMIVALIIAIILIKVVINKLTTIADEKKAPENKEYLKNTDYSKIKEKKRTSVIRKIIAPDGVDPAPNGYMTIQDGGKDVHLRSFTIVGMPKRTVYASTFAELFDFQNCISSVFIEPIADSTMIRKMDRHLVVLESEHDSTGDSNRRRKLGHQYAETEGWVSEVENGDNSFYDVSFLFTLYAETIKELNDLSDAFRAIALNKQIYISSTYGVQAEAYATNAPLNRKINIRSKFIKSDTLTTFHMDKYSVSTLFNYTQGSFGHHNGIPLGRDLHTGKPYVFDIYDSALDGHTICMAGKTRSGKSALIKMIAGRYIPHGYRFVAVDSQSPQGLNEGEFSAIARVSGGVSYQLKPNSDCVLNIFDVTETTKYDKKKRRDIRTLDLSDKIAQVINALLTMVQGNSAIENFDTFTFINDILTDTVKELYADIGIVDGEPDSLYEREGKSNGGLLSAGKIPKKLPTMTECYKKLLIKERANTDKAKELAYKSCLSALKEYVRDLYYTESTLLFLKKDDVIKAKQNDTYVLGYKHSDERVEKVIHIQGIRNYFDGQSTITVSKYSPFTNIDISQLPDNEKLVARQIAIDYVTENFIKKNSESLGSANKLLAIFDEAHENFVVEYARVSIAASVSTAAKRHVGIILSTQTIKEYTLYPETDKILGQAAIKMVFKQDYKDRDLLLKTLPITESQADIIVSQLGGNDTNAKTASEKRKHKGEMCVIEDRKVCFVKVDYLKSAEEAFVETDPEELERIYGRRQGGAYASGM